MARQPFDWTLLQPNKRQHFEAISPDGFYEERQSDDSSSDNPLAWDREVRLAYEKRLEEIASCKTQVLHQTRMGLEAPSGAENAIMTQFGISLTSELKDFDLEDPLLALWTPEMAAAWIIWRSKAHVLRHFEPSFVGAAVWVKNIDLHGFPGLIKRGLPKDGHELSKLNRVMIGQRFIGHDGKPYDLAPQISWENQLLAPLMREEIRAFGLKCDGSGDRVKIPPEVWASGRFEVHDKTYTYFAVQGEPKYYDIGFVATDLLAVFEPNLGRFRRWKTLDEKNDRPTLGAKILQREWPLGFNWEFVNREARTDAVYEILNRKENWSKDNLKANRAPFNDKISRDGRHKFVERILEIACEAEIEEVIV